jgi:prepilin-type processing-associated H-X9-DG protein
MADIKNTGQGLEKCFKAALVLFAVGWAIVLVLPLFRATNTEVRMPQCNANLREIGLAMRNYAGKYGCFPPAYTVDKHGRRMHSWRVLLLEFSDPDLYAEYDFSRPWDAPENVAFATKLKKDGLYRLYRCQVDVEDPSWTSYVMLVGPMAFSDGPTGRKPEEITDGLENTAMIVEMSHSGISWTAPYDLNVAEMSFKINDPDHACPRSCHSGGVGVLFADGHHEFFRSGKSAVDEAHLRAIVTINGGEDMSKFQQE